MLRGEAINTNLIVFILAQLGLKPTIFPHFGPIGAQAHDLSTLDTSMLTIAPPMWFFKEIAHYAN
jgi:hypothetical protein